MTLLLIVAGLAGITIAFYASVIAWAFLFPEFNHGKNSAASDNPEPPFEYVEAEIKRMDVFDGVITDEHVPPSFCPRIKCDAKPEWYHDDYGIKRVDALINVPSLVEWQHVNPYCTLVQMEWSDGKQELWDSYRASGFPLGTFGLKLG